MRIFRLGRLSRLASAIAILVLAFAPHFASAAQPDSTAPPQQSTQNYVIGPGDTLQVFVWRNPDLTVSVPVRPDGKISIPLVEDIECAGKTPTQLAREIEGRLMKFVTDPLVTVIVSGFVGPYTQQIRIVGEAARPQALPYRANMTLLDAMIAVGGLTQFAAGNRARLVRGTGPQQTSSRVRIESLLRDGDISANTDLRPGDIIIIPQSFF